MNVLYFQNQSNRTKAKKLHNLDNLFIFIHIYLQNDSQSTKIVFVYNEQRYLNKTFVKQNKTSKLIKGRLGQFLLYF